MTRRLLPYEHQLVETLGVTEEEYLDFLSAQHDYTISLEEKFATPQNLPAVALVLTIVGTLFQVAAALLAKPPETPDQKNQRLKRQQRFAPRTGFNSTQSLAEYGDPVNLVYCNSSVNPTGGVRVGTSLIWSAVQSKGSSQYMQTLMIISSSQLGSIDFSRSAFGQTPVRQFTAQKTWTYYSQDGNVRFNNLVFPASATTDDPTYSFATDIAYKIQEAGSRKEGFSQAFSPTTLITCGIYAPIPINVLVQERDGDGEVQGNPLEINILGTSFISSYWTGTSRPLIPVGTRFTLRFKQSIISSKSDVKLQAAEDRVTLFSNIDAASTYKLGSAKFKLAAPLLSSDLENTSIDVIFECIETGCCPYAEYDDLTYKAIIRDWREEKRILVNRNNEIDAILLNPPPIYDPIVFAAVNAELDASQATIDVIQDWAEAARYYRRRRRNPLPTSQRLLYLDTLADEASLSDPIVAEIANEILTLENELIDNDALTKAERRAIKKEIKRLQRQLSRALEQYGAEFGLIEALRPGAGIVSGRQEIRYLNKLANAESRKQFRLLLDSVGATGGGRNRDAEAARDAALRAEKTANLARISVLTTQLADDQDKAERYFFTKCLVKYEEASYQTITDCKIINFSLKAKVFQRINGRQEEYGEEDSPFKLSDNGFKKRTAMFWMWYRESPTSVYKRVNCVFVIRRGADQENYIDLQFIATTNGVKWEFKFEPIAESVAEFKKIGLVSGLQFAYIENNGPTSIVTNSDGTKVAFAGIFRNADGLLPPRDKCPIGVSEWGLFSLRGDTQIDYSFSNGPEISIAAVTEQRDEALSLYPSLYDNLALVGFNAYSGQGVQDLRSFTVFVKEGKKVRALNSNGTLSSTLVSSNYAPEIFIDTALDAENGIGRLVTEQALNLTTLALAKQFCMQNSLFFDGVISDQSSWRQFWATVAPYSLLELVRLGGKEALAPALPVDAAGNVTRNISITALFNAGNILEDSYKEDFIDYGNETLDLIATVIYRYTELNETFPRNRSVEVRRKGVTDLAGFRQTFDLSDFVTNKRQAVLFAKMLCQQRRYIRRTIEFKTFPTDSPLFPGAYIYVDVGNRSWEGLYSGQVMTGGELNAPLTSIPNGTYNALLYRSGQTPVSTTASVSSGIASGLAGYKDWLFVLGSAVKNKRTFRVIEVAMDEEGEVTVKAVEHPTDANGQSLISEGLLSSDTSATGNDLSNLFDVLE